MENFTLIAGNTKYWLVDKGSIKENDCIYTFPKHESINADYEVNIMILLLKSFKHINELTDYIKDS